MPALAAAGDGAALSALPTASAMQAAAFANGQRTSALARQRYTAIPAAIVTSPKTMALRPEEQKMYSPVSYTHLDVYKRQLPRGGP